MTAVQRSAGLTAKGARTRARIVDAAAALVHQHGVADTTVEEVKKNAGVSSSQLYHYFTDKDALVRAVLHRQTELILATQDQADLGSLAGLRAWRDGVIAHARSVSGAGGCPLGHLVGQLAETDQNARLELAEGFHRWAAVLRTALHDLDRAGDLRPGTDPDNLADTLLATLQGGLLLAQVHRDAGPLETALDTLIGLATHAPTND
ncbi:TetR/AcrR family transcriptional regulator [Pseudonocardia sp. GCM10023141]|uniref:TetR/AcrR family transcriptional regulator n=1 Tax=Pseudonocardia sp. GCM10023141 TaxID=3252653 RepID=UPI00360F0ED8